ncbi:sugar ABC transporter permease [Alicyclobacillus sacchari]|uniref:carbohydrate ABC transporter permease n=1 Tax=Alicyclobacillus sacchari TaxID=392010 RepID=UPI0023EA0A62|nr:sugar ABC transporter permease [Alicyclobacillus sacchari]GMA57220.1 sugar ABC transporter permease [Alicyclobacillus sacchari]
MSRALTGVLASQPRVRKQIARQIQSSTQGWFMMLPALAFLTLFVFIPMAYVVYLSMFQSNLLTPKPRFVGWENYIHLLTAPDFAQALTNTAVLAAGMLLLSLPLALILAMLVNMRLWGTRVYRTVLFGPYVIPLVGSGLMFTLLFNTDGGLVNRIVEIFGGQPIDWLGGRRSALAAVLILSVWQYTGYYMLVFLAGLQNVPQHLRESCQVDGGGRWSTLRHVTLPAMAPTVFFAIVICLIQTFQTFDQVYVMTAAAPMVPPPRLPITSSRRDFKCTTSALLLLLLSSYLPCWHS